MNDPTYIELTSTIDNFFSILRWIGDNEFPRPLIGMITQGVKGLEEYGKGVPLYNPYTDLDENEWKEDVKAVLQELQKISHITDQDGDLRKFIFAFLFPEPEHAIMFKLTWG
jgi:hypothetical protein